MIKIILSTLNGRYHHSSFGLRYLRANLGEFHAQSVIKEYIIKKDPKEIALDLAGTSDQKQMIVGFGVYIWNVGQTLEVIQELKKIRADWTIVVGGPEVSYEIEDQEILQLVDFVIQGEAEVSFYQFVKAWMNGLIPENKIIPESKPNIKDLKFPYSEYTEEDIAHRVIYVEASRGCPYKCEYCLSSLDIAVRNFELEPFLAEMKSLLDRGVRQFKFVDRTFNLSPKISFSILDFFYQRKELGLFLHFEMVPDRLPDELKTLIEKFPSGSLQFEIGIQTWNPLVAQNVSRRQDYKKVEENFKFLSEKTRVHTHADLIFGLPGEGLESFIHGFNQLLNLGPDEVQVGRLKRLKGAPIKRHEGAFKMTYSKQSPFEILETKDLTREQLNDLQVFADFWDMVSNSGRYPRLIEIFKRYHHYSFHKFNELFQHLFLNFKRTHSIPLSDLDIAIESWLKLDFAQDALSWKQLEENGREERRRAKRSALRRQAMHI